MGVCMSMAHGCAFKTRDERQLVFDFVVLVRLLMPILGLYVAHWVTFAIYM
jgi:hypothetical protein